MKRVSVFRALLQHLATGSARVLVVNLEDLWLETEPQNRPGTGPEQPNWRLRAARTLEEFGRDALVLSTLEGVHKLRSAKGGSPSDC